MFRFSKKNDVHQFYIIIAFIIGFIILYFFFLYYFYVLPHGLEISIFILIGFSIIIIVIFYFLLFMTNNEKNNISFKIRFLSEDWIKIILIILMSIAIFIPPISIYTIIIEWNAIGFFNYFRAIVFLVGGAFLPGACIFKIIFPKSNLHERFKIEPFLLKITIYPCISLAFIGTCTLIIDVIGIHKRSFAIILFVIILILFILDLFIQKHRYTTNFKSFHKEIKISKYTLLILLIALAIIIIALGNHLKSKYSVFFDQYEAISYVHYIGRSKRTNFDKLYIYSTYWSYISFGLGALCGIPFININALLFPFLYLFVTSMYLLIKAILIDLKESYAMLSTIFVVTFSGLFFIYDSYNGTSWLIFGGIMFFWYKSFALFLFTISTALLIVVLKPSNEMTEVKIFRRENMIIIFLSTILLFQSYMIYMLPILPAFILFALFFLFSKGKKRSLFHLLIFFISFSINYIVFDLLFDFYFSYNNTHLFYGFFDLKKPVNTKEILYFNAIRFHIILILTCIFGIFCYMFIIRLSVAKTYKITIPNFMVYYSIYIGFLLLYYFILNIFFYWTPISFILVVLKLDRIISTEVRIVLDILLFLMISIGSLFVFILIFKKYSKQRKNKEKSVNNNNKKGQIIAKAIFSSVLIIFSILIIIFILNRFIFKKNDFFYFYLNNIFLEIGFVGISGFCLSYFCYKKNKQLFFILLLWAVSILFIASILIFRAWNLYPNMSPSKINFSLYDHMNIWFSRLWYYAIIPLSIFSSIGLLRLKDYIKSKNLRKINNRNLKTVLKLTLISFLIVLILSNTILSCITYNDGQDWHVEDDEAHFIGWISENLNPKDGFITDKEVLYRLMLEFPYYNPYFLPSEFREFLADNTFPIISYEYDENYFLDYIEYLDGYRNILGFRDNDYNGGITFNNDFERYVKNENIEFMIRSTDKSKTFTIDLNLAKKTAIRFMIQSNGFYCYNNDTLEKITNINNDEWYTIKIYFECTDDNYQGLDKYHWKIRINSTEYGDYEFMNNTNSIKHFSSYSDISDSNYVVYLNELRYSWEPSIYNIFFHAHNILKYNLKGRDIEYYFKSRDSDYYDKFCDDLNSDFNYFFLEIDEFLLANLYTKKLHEYGDIVIYKS